MIRRFSESLVEIAVGPGAASAPRKAATYAVLARLNSVPTGALVGFENVTHTESVPYYTFSVEGEQLALRREGVSSSALSTAGLAGVWCLFVMTKPSGFATPFMYIFRFDTEEWFKETGGSVISNAEPNPNGFLQFGKWGGGNFLDGDIAAVAIYGSALSEEEVEKLVEVTNLGEWLTTGPAPAGLYFFNQEEESEKVVDLAGSGAEEVNNEGTTYVAEEPPIPYAPEEEGTPGAPEAELANGMTEVLGTVVKLHGHVKANGAPTLYYIEYGPEEGVYTGGHFPVSEDLDGGEHFKNKGVKIIFPEGYLEKNTLYYCRIVAVNEHGTGHSNEIEFATAEDTEEPPEEGDADVQVLIGGELVVAERSILVGGELIPAPIE